MLAVADNLLDESYKALDIRFLLISFTYTVRRFPADLVPEEQPDTPFKPPQESRRWSLWRSGLDDLDSV